MDLARGCRPSRRPRRPGARARPGARRRGTARPSAGRRPRRPRAWCASPTAPVASGLSARPTVRSRAASTRSLDQPMDSWPASTAATTSTPVAGPVPARTASSAASPVTASAGPGWAAPTSARAALTRTSAAGRGAPGTVLGAGPPRSRDPRDVEERVLEGGVRAGGAAGQPVRDRAGAGAHPHGVPRAGDVEDRLGDVRRRPGR